MRIVLSALTLSALLICVSPAKAQFEPLAAKIPSSANAIMLLDAKQLMATPLAVREGWRDKYEQAFAAGLVAIPPGAERMLLAAEFDYEYMKPRWELAAVELTEARSLAQIARATKGILDPIGNIQTVALRDDSYVVDLGSKRLGAMSPANRQAVARWLREVQSRTAPALSPYLKASLVASDNSQIVMAFDLEEAIPPDVVRARLASSPAIAGKKVNVEAAAKALDSIRGMALEVAVADKGTGRLRIHFNGDSSVLAPVALPLMTELLEGLGARIDDIASWKVTAEPKRITLAGPLSTAGMKRVFSLIDNPTSAILASSEAKEPAPPSNTSTSQPNAQGYASQKYFKSLTSVLDDVRKESKDAKTLSECALWLDRWARRIDRLPILSVDPQLLEFGRAVSSDLRSMSASVRGIGIKSAGRAAQVYQSSYVDLNYSYYGDARETDSQRRAIRADEKAKGATTARDLAAGIENGTAKVRQALTEKYQLPF